MDYPGNTRKEREAQQEKTINYQKDKENKKPQEKPEKNIEKIVVGEVIQKKKTLGQRFKHIFFGGDAKQAARFISSDVLLPALRNLIVEMTSKGIERIVYGDAAPRRFNPQRTDYQGASTRYYLNNPLMQRPMDPRVRANLPDQPRYRQNRHEMNDIILATKEEAEEVLEQLNNILETYDVVALADLYVLLGLETSYIDNKWGWHYLNNAQVRQIRQGFLLELPLLEEI